MPKDSRAAFKYRGRSDESVVRRAKESAGSYDSYVKGDMLWYKSKEGENCIRILPRASTEDFEKWGDHWGIDIYIHYNVGPDNGTYLCSDKMKGEPCPVCEARRSIEDQEEADQLKPSRRILCWLIDRNSEKDGPKLWSMPHGTSKDISAVSQVKGGGGVLLIDHPDEGYDVYFDREGEKKRTKYKRIEVARQPSYLSEDDDIQKKWLTYVEENPLSEILEFFTPDYVEKVLFGQGESKKDRDDERPSRSSRRGAEEEPDTDRRGSSRRGREEEEPERGSRRGARDEPEETDDRRGSSRRGREEEPEPEPERTVRGVRRGREEPEAEEEPPRGGRRRGEEPEPEPERTTRRRGAREEAEDPPSDDPPRGRTERVRPKAEEPEPEKEEEPESDTKARLSRLGRRNR